MFDVLAINQRVEGVYQTVGVSVFQVTSEANRKILHGTKLGSGVRDGSSPANADKMSSLPPDTGQYVRQLRVCTEPFPPLFCGQ